MLRSIRADLFRLYRELDDHPATIDVREGLAEIIDEIDRELNEGYYPDED